MYFLSYVTDCVCFYPSLFTLSTAILNIGSSLPGVVSLNPEKSKTDSSGFEYYQMFSVIQNLEGLQRRFLQQLKQFLDWSSKCKGPECRLSRVPRRACANTVIARQSADLDVSCWV